MQARAQQAKVSRWPPITRHSVTPRKLASKKRKNFLQAIAATNSVTQKQSFSKNILEQAILGTNPTPISLLSQPSPKTDTFRPWALSRLALTPSPTSPGIIANRDRRGGGGFSHRPILILSQRISTGTTILSQVRVGFGMVAIPTGTFCRKQKRLLLLVSSSYITTMLENSKMQAFTLRVFRFLNEQIMHHYLVLPSATLPPRPVQRVCRGRNLKKFMDSIW